MAQTMFYLMSAVELVRVKIWFTHLKALKLRMRRLVLDLSVAQILSEKINQTFLTKKLGFIILTRSVGWRFISDWYFFLKMSHVWGLNFQQLKKKFFSVSISNIGKPSKAFQILNVRKRSKVILNGCKTTSKKLFVNLVKFSFILRFCHPLVKL